MSKKYLCCFIIYLTLIPFYAVYAQQKKEAKVITINSVRVMELVKKVNRSQWTTQSETAQSSTGTAEKTSADGNIAGSTNTAKTAANSVTPAQPDQTKPAESTDAVPPAAGETDSATPVTPAANNITASGTTTASAEQDTAKNPETVAAAQKAVDEKKDQIIIFTGDVSISVKDGNTVSTVQADKVIFNRSENTMEAIGNVRYSRKTGSSAAEEFIGGQLLFNIEEMEGVFVDGLIKQPPRNKKIPPFTIQAGVVGRDSSSTIGFKNAIMSTNTDLEEDPLWSICASRIWLLPGTEFAFANGYFSVGVVPLFYIPFFYHPADEMIVHPVCGTRNREGAFIQTTTYLIGRKPLERGTDSKASFSNFMRSDTLKKQERIGLFYKNLDEDETKTEPAYLKLVADAYSTLGSVVGLDGKFVPQNNPIKQIDFSFYFGMSRTLFQSPEAGSKSYTAYDKRGNRHYNKSYFYGMQVPFRYRAHFNMNISKSPVNFTLTMPFPSDPFFKKDFFDRAEDMNWFNYALNQEKLAKGSNLSSESSYTWKMDASVRPSIKEIQPWINNLNLDTASFLVEFSEKDNKGVDPMEKDTAPHRKFFYPRLLKPTGKISISGTLLSNSMFERKKTGTVPELHGIQNPYLQEKSNGSEEEKDSDGKKASSADTPPEAVDSTVSPASAAAASGGVTADSPAAGTAAEKKEPPEFIDIFIPAFRPVYDEGFSNRLTYSLTYTGDLNALQETTFHSEKWLEPKDIKWTNYDSRYYQLRGSAALKGTLSYAQNFISMNSSLTFNGNYQRHPWVRDDKKLKNLELNNFKANVYTLKNTNAVTISPLVFTSLFRATSFTWNISQIVVKNKFTGTYEKPKWETEKVKWDKDFITAHAGTAVFGVTIEEKYTQKLSFSANLPPLLRSYSGKADFSFPYGTLALSTRLFEKEKAKKTWYWDPFKADLNWSFPYEIKSSQSYTYNIEEKEHERLYITAGWKYVSFFYTQSREIPYKLTAGTGWQPRSTKKEFIPFETGLSFSNSSDPFTLYAWKNRIKLQFSLNSAVKYNLIRVTDSYFTFAPTFTFNIHEFWTLSFGTSSRNDVIARYFQKMFGLPVAIPGNSNIFTDLAHSFYFWDRAKRESSGFKLQSLDIGLTHNLKDWELKFTCNIKPEQKKDGVRIYYTFTPTILFAVEWKPISDIKVQAKKKDNTFSVERGEIR
ncbi:MAG: LPS-assembly protein LptD [Treponema sp.]